MLTKYDGLFLCPYINIRRLPFPHFLFALRSGKIMDCLATREMVAVLFCYYRRFKMCSCGIYR
nr:MAG TPA_asm: hypothetical protein [Caudoviricetes sp.]